MGGNRVWGDPFKYTHKLAKGRLLKYAKGKLAMYRNAEAKAPVWTYPSGNDGYVITPVHILRLIVPLRSTQNYQLQCADMPTGIILWSVPLPGKPLQYGIAVDADGRVFVTLEDGRIVCLSSGGAR